MNKTEFKPNVMMFIGNRTCGKTFLMNKMLREDYIHKYHYIIILNPSINLQDDWEWLEKYSHVYFFDNNFKEVIEETQKSLKSIIYTHGKPACPHVLIILDDCIDTEVLRFKGIIDSVACRGRHYKLSCWIASQRLSGIPRSTRLNSNYIFLFAMWNYTELEQYSLQYIPKQKHKAFQSKILEYYKTPYAFILLDNLARIDKRVQKGFTNESFFDEL